MRLCPRCKTEFVDATLELCPFDDAAIVSAEDYYEAEGDPLLGTTIAGRFRIVGRVGVGAMGTVYRAVQASVERQVALKILRPDLTRDPDTAARFHREAHATSSLKHPNTVTLYDFGQSPEGYLYIAMELLEGSLLGRIVKEEGALPVDRAVRIITQVARSLAEAHRKGIVHRDLKPDNIMLAHVAGQEVVKVLDFGIAKVVRGDKRLDALETQAGTVFGTPRYMSPEQAQSKPLDARSDLYSLGVILYQMLTGHAPFEDSDAVVVMARHIKTKPRRPSDVRPDLRYPPALERLVMRMLEKDRNRRPHSAEELIDVLTRIHVGSTDEEYSILAPRPKRPLGRLVPVAAAAAALFLLAAGGVIAYALTRAPEHEPGLPAASGAESPTVGANSPPPDVGATDLPTPPPYEDRVAITLDSEPPGAEVFRDGSRLGRAPMVVTERIGSEVSFAFELTGRQSTTKRLVVDEETRLVVAVLPELGAKSSRGPGGRVRGPGGKQPDAAGGEPVAGGAKVGGSEPVAPEKTPTKQPGIFQRWE